MYLLYVLALFLPAAVPVLPGNTPGNQDEDHGYVIKSWDVDDGLPVNAVSSIIQDDEGYLWITSYSGISRFDGHEFRIFNSSNLPGIQSNRFHSSIRDSAGNIWFYPEYGGVLRYKDGEFSFYDEDTGFDGGVITRLPVTIDGVAHFPTANGLYTFTDGAFQQVYRTASVGRTAIQNYSHGGDYIVLSTAEGLVVLKNGIKQRIISLDQEAELQHSHSAVFEDFIYAIRLETLQIFAPDGTAQELPQALTGGLESIRVVASDGHLFLSTKRGLFVFSESDPLAPQWHLPEFTEVVTDTYTDRAGTLWLKVSKGKYYQFREGRMLPFSPAVISDEFRLAGIFEDREGVMWFASENRGLLRISASIVETIATDPDLPNDSILGVFKDSRNRVWFGIRGFGLAMRDEEGRISHFTEFKGAHVHNVNAIAEGPDGSIFFHLHYKGLGRIYPDGRREIIRLGGDTLNTQVTAIRFHGNRMFTATFSGLHVHTLEGRALNYYELNDGRRAAAIQNMQLTPEGNLWLTTINGGVSYLEVATGRITNYNHTDGLALNSVRGLYIDREAPETVWFGTEGNGLSRLQNGHITSVNSSAGLFDDQIHSIIEDDFGKLWMSSNRGVFYVRKEQLNAYLDGQADYITSEIFRRNHGMLNEECNGGNANSVFSDAQGRLYYPTQEGIAIFDTNDPRLRQEAAARPHIQSLSVRGEPRPLRAAAELQPGSNDFTISFTAFEYISPERIQFMYKLEGYDNEWIYAGTRRSATYTNLPPREYRFLLKASTDQFPEGLPYAEASITLLPHFYQQRWFSLLAGILLIGSILFLHRLRIHQVEAREQKLQKLVQSRTKALEKEKNAAMQKQQVITRQADELRLMNQTKDRFFNIIAHDLKGPVGGIRGLLNLLDEDYDSLTPAERRQFISSASKTSESVLKLLMDLLDWARLQSGHSKPELQILDAEQAVYEALNVLKPLAARKKIELKTRFIEAASVQADHNMLNTILRNFISNAIKFSFPKSEVLISVLVDNGYVCFAVKDHGTGMTKEDQAKLFRPDVSVSRPGTAEETGTGLGLLLCKEMAHVLGGRIELDSSYGKGATFTVCLPAAHSPAVEMEEGYRKQEP